MANDDSNHANAPSSKTAVYVTAAVILGLLVYVGVGFLSADCGGSYEPKSASYRGTFASLRCRYRAR